MTTVVIQGFLRPKANFEIQMESTLKERGFWRMMRKNYDDGLSRATRDHEWIIRESTRKDISKSQLHTLSWHKKSRSPDMYHLARGVELTDDVRNINMGCVTTALS